MHITIDYDVILNVLLREVRGTCVRTLLSIAGIDLIPKGTSVQPGGAFPLLFGSDYTATEEVRRDTTAWLWGNGLREAIESFESVLRELHRVLHVQARGQIDVEHDIKWSALKARLFAEADIAFDQRRTWPQRLDYLKRTFGISVSWRDEFDSLVLARNCLTHLRGVVEARFCNDDKLDTLIVRYRYPELFVVDQDCKETTLPPPPCILRDCAVKVRPDVAREKRFAKGTRIMLDSDTFSEVMYTVWAIGQECIVQARSHARSQGIPEAANA